MIQVVNKPVISQLPDIPLLGGGVPIIVTASVVGAIGVGGASTAEQEHDCAEAALLKI